MVKVNNWFVLIIGLQYLAAGALDIYQGRYAMASIWISYGVACGGLAII